MHEVKLRVANYIYMEEMKTLRTKFYTNIQPTDRKLEKTFSWTDLRPRERQPPLSVSRSCILEEALQTDLIPPPSKNSQPA